MCLCVGGYEIDKSVFVLWSDELLGMLPGGQGGCSGYL